MNIWHRWFGKWETIEEVDVTVTMSNVLRGSFEIDAIVFIQKNSKTGVERAFYDPPFGGRQWTTVGKIRRMQGKLT